MSRNNRNLLEVPDLRKRSTRSSCTSDVSEISSIQENKANQSCGLKTDNKSNTTNNSFCSTDNSTGKIFLACRRLSDSNTPYSRVRLVLQIVIFLAFGILLNNFFMKRPIPEKAFNINTNITDSTNTVVDIASTSTDELIETISHSRSHSGLRDGLCDNAGFNGSAVSLVQGIDNFMCANKWTTQLISTEDIVLFLIIA